MLHSLKCGLAAASLALLVALPAATAQDGPPQMPPAQVEITTAEERLLVPEMDVSATVISVNDSRIAAEVEGPLVWIAQVGTPLKKGDVIARIDSRLLEIQHRSAKANLERLKADMVFRDQDVKRFEELARSDNTSKARLQEVVARRAMLAQEILEAEARLERTAGDLERTEIRAPFPGHIVERLASVGEYINIGAEVARFVDTYDIEVAMAAPIAIARYLTAGAEVTVVGADKTLSLPIRTIVPVGDTTSRMMEVRLSLKEGEWLIGTPVKVKLPKGPARQAVAVPRDALVLKGASAFIYKIGDDMKAEQIPADLREAVGLWVATSGGIAPGDKIVIRGGERLAPGQSVMISGQ